MLRERLRFFIAYEFHMNFMINLVELDLILTMILHLRCIIKVVLLLY